MRNMTLTHERALSDYNSVVGATLEHVPTPALVIDLDLLGINLATMAHRFAQFPTQLRPHVKVHKCTEIARRQMAAGAVGVATATAHEAAAMAHAGIGDVLVANQVVGEAKIGTLLEAPADTRLTVVVDDPRNVAALSEAATAARRPLDVLIEIDIGQGRCGVRDRDQALELARQIEDLPGVELRGMQGYEGHCMLEPDRDLRAQEAEEAIAKLTDAVDHLETRGFPCHVVSGGGTGTYFITGANPHMTEIQAGSYALMDAFHDNLVPGGFQLAMTVLATVISLQGHTVVLDAGRKAVGTDFTSPLLVDHRHLKPRFFAEEHGIIDFPERPPMRVGDHMQLLAGYGPTTANLHDVAFIIHDGAVHDVWPIDARGPRRAS